METEKDCVESNRDVKVEVKTEALIEEGEDKVAKKGKNLKRSHATSSRSAALHPPTDYQTFLSGEEVTLHLVVKDADGDEIKSVALVKTQYGTGSFGWALSDKVIVDNGEGGDMSVSLNANCVIQGSKPKKMKT